jgi:gliding motility-associated-like protein
VKRLVKRLIFLMCALCFYFAAFAQGTSNQGTEFWTAWMMHSNSAAGSGSSSMKLYITGDAATTVTVSSADGSFSSTHAVTPNQITVVPIDASLYLEGQGSFSKGIHITSLKPVVVYAHIYASNRSGATLVLPVASLANDYYTINFTQKPATTGGAGGFIVPVYSTLCVIGTQDSTEVEITPAAALVDGTGKGQVKKITLNKGQLYQALSTSDLTGTRVRSISTGTEGCKKIAVYSGSSFIVIGATGSSGDNLFQQSYPTAVWGKNYVTAPLATRAYDVIRIVCSDPSATVTVNGTPLNKATLVNKFYYELPPASEPQVITSDKPIQVAQYAITEGNGNSSVGDPEMIYISPIEQGLKKVTLYSPNEFAIAQSYINVIIPTSSASSFVLDGVPYTGTFKAISNSAYSYAQIPVSSGATHVISANSMFNAIAYGFARFESYGYAAGTNLSTLNEFITLSDVSKASTQLNGCTGVPYYLQLTVPFQPKAIVWDPANGTPTARQSNPVAIKTEVKADSITLYTYRFEKSVIYKTGNYTATATVTLPVVTNADCGAERTINYNFNITDYPIADFKADTSNCAGNTVGFTDTSNPAGSTIAKWVWKFNDPKSTATNPDTSSLQNPKHLFTASGNYNVTLTVVNENGCESGTVTKTIHINRNPVANFSFNLGTTGFETTFTDKSSASEGKITEWKWDFDDGSPTETRTDSLPFTHLFPELRTYNVSLTIITDGTCSSTKIIPVLVSPLPQVNFAVPDACIQNAAAFTNTTIISDNTQELLNYKWEFDDPRATASNPNTSALKNPTHRFTEVRGDDNPYKVKLTVTSINGRVSELTQNFVVNGSQPKAQFQISDVVCSSEPLAIISKSYVVDLGKVTKYIIYYDYNGDKTNMEIYDKDHLAIPADSVFTHKYEGFNIPASKKYTIYIEVYSGGDDCKDVYFKDITVNANPKVKLIYPPDICQEQAAIQFGEDKTINGSTDAYAGSAVFSGAGVSASGLFDPKKAGPGVHQIKYTFTANVTGCTYQDSLSIRVYPTPLITGNRNLTINAGGQIAIDPQVLSLNGTALTYKWTPSLGLNSDRAISPVASPATETDYLLTVTSKNGCVATAYFKVSVLQMPFTYNTFTPNGDNINDYWEITNIQYYPKATVEVFNRNGNKVFYSIGYPNRWDGRYNGASLPAGTYYYIINLNNGKKPLSGPVTIIR